MKTGNRLCSRKPGKWDIAFVAVCAVAAFLLWNHPDISETSIHTRILLDDIFKGRFFQFYQDTMDAKQTIGYANAAHYHIVFYLICAVWNLPLYLLGLLVPVGDFAFLLWTKALAVAAWVVSGILVGKLAKKLPLSEERASWASYFFWLCPVAFFSVLCMGQYDSICLVFILIALLLYMDNKLLSFVLVMGAAMVFKMFALFLLVPLLLLREKRILHILGYAVLSLWLYLPGSLLFRGRDGDMAFFNDLIAQRLFVQQLPTVGSASLMLTILAAVYFLCWLWKPKSEQQLQQFSLYLCFFVFAVMFLTVQWHPQWLILLAPFLILTSMQSRQFAKWTLLNAIYYSGFFILTAYFFAGQLESNMFSFGVLGEIFGLIPAADAVRTNTIYFDLLPYGSQLAAVAFAAPLLIGIVGKFPYKEKQLVDRLADLPVKSVPVWAMPYAVFAVAYGCFWFAPTVFAWVRGMGIL